VRAAASGASAPDTGSAERGGRVLPAAGLAHFFARTVRWKKQGLEVVSEWSVLERMNCKGVCVRWKAVWSETEHGCNHMDLQGGKRHIP